MCWLNDITILGSQQSLFVLGLLFLCIYNQLSGRPRTIHENNIAPVTLPFFRSLVLSIYLLAGGILFFGLITKIFNCDYLCNTIFG